MESLDPLVNFFLLNQCNLVGPKCPMKKPKEELLYYKIDIMESTLQQESAKN